MLTGLVPSTLQMSGTSARTLSAVLSACCFPVASSKNTAEGPPLTVISPGPQFAAGMVNVTWPTSPIVPEAMTPLPSSPPTVTRPCNTVPRCGCTVSE